ncbi:MAG: sugar phosphate isomerase/epimerase family protein [Candidatus Aminicenantia bacterium]
MNFKIFVHLPFHAFKKYSQRLLESGYGPELYFNSKTLYSSDEEIEEVSNFLRKNSIPCTMHAPYLDLSPGAIEESVRKITIERFQRAVYVAKILRPLSIVFHPNWDTWRYEDEAEIWLENARETFSEISKNLPSETLLLFENVYDQTPDFLLRLLGKLNIDNKGLCFDTGHFLNFSTISLEEWLNSIERNLKEIHLHDNLGKKDEHLDIGVGIFPFHNFFSYLKKKNLHPILTIEAHSLETLIRAENSLREIINSIYRGLC